MVWRRAATVMLDALGNYLDADDAALELLGVGSVDELRSLSPERFAALPSDREEQEAWRRAYFASQADGVLAELAFRRLDGELVRVRTAVLDEGEGRYRAVFYPVERPTTNLAPRIYRIAEVISEWRTAERRLVDIDPASEEAERLATDIELLREQHHMLFRSAQGRYGPAHGTPGV